MNEIINKRLHTLSVCECKIYFTFLYRNNHELILNPQNIK